MTTNEKGELYLHMRGEFGPGPIFTCSFLGAHTNRCQAQEAIIPGLFIYLTIITLICYI